MDKELNPYQPPQSTVAKDVADLKKTAVVLIILLVLITCGLYVPFWYWSRRHALDRMAPEGGVTGLCMAAFVLLLATFVGSFVVAMATGGADSADERDLFFQILNLVYVIVIVILGFRVKGIVEANYPDRISGIAVFFLNLYYLQYKINRLGSGEPQSGSLGLTH